MLPRPESIFNIGGGGDWGEEEEAYNTVAAIGSVAAPEGLRIAIQQHHHGRRGSNNIVTKATLKPSWPTGRSRRQVKSLPELGFLRTCLFCMGELSLQKEVYMYRGDLGFCSVECRYKQILQDERREFEVTYKRESTASLNFRASSKIGESDPRKRISVVA